MWIPCIPLTRLRDPACFVVCCSARATAWVAGIRCPSEWACLQIWHSVRHPLHKVYSCLLRNKPVTHSTPVWAMGMTYVPLMRRTLHYCRLHKCSRHDPRRSRPATGFCCSNDRDFLFLIPCRYFQQGYEEVPFSEDALRSASVHFSNIMRSCRFALLPSTANRLPQIDCIAPVRFKIIAAVRYKIYK